MPIEAGLQWIAASGVDPTAQANLAQRRAGCQGVDDQAIVSGVSLEVDGIHPDRRGSGRHDENIAPLQVSDIDHERELDIGQSQRSGRRLRFGLARR